jgi:cobalamin biosynthesis protein CobD/CbiB
MHAVLAITYGQAKAIGVVIVVALVVAAVAWAWLMKTLVQKAVGALIFVVLAALVWFQRDSFQDCAAKVRENTELSTRGLDTTCAFFGQDVNISTGQ